MNSGARRPSAQPHSSDIDVWVIGRGVNRKCRILFKAIHPQKRQPLARSKRATLFEINYLRRSARDGPDRRAHVRRINFLTHRSKLICLPLDVDLVHDGHKTSLFSASPFVRRRRTFQSQTTETEKCESEREEAEKLLRTVVHRRRKRKRRDSAPENLTNIYLISREWRRSEAGDGLSCEENQNRNMCEMVISTLIVFLMAEREYLFMKWHTSAPALCFRSRNSATQLSAASLLSAQASLSPHRFSINPYGNLRAVCDCFPLAFHLRDRMRSHEYSSTGRSVCSVDT